MKNKTYLKASFRQISKSLGRFIAIVLIILLGTLIFVGIKTTQPVLDHSADHYVEQQKLSDLQVVSTGGLTAEDEKIAQQIKGAQVETGYQLFYADVDKNEVSQIFSYNKQNKQNKLVLTKGRLPEKDHELVLDTLAEEAGYQIGDTFQIKEHEQLKKQNFTIVGFVNTPQFISTNQRGFTNVGNGTVNFFAFVPENNFKSDVKGIMYLRFDDLRGKETYSEAYKDQLDKKRDQVEQAFAQRPQARLAEIKQTANDELIPVKKELADGEKALAAGEKAIQQASDQINQQKQQIPQLPAAQQAALTQQLTAAENEIAEQKTALQKEKDKLTEAQKKITDSEKELAAMKTPTYRFNERFDNVAFQEYGDLSGRIASIADVFPVFFFFIAALITFTTMTRMVEENRREVGTMKALGYSKFEIAKKYLIYSSSAAFLGVVLGVIIGTEFLPRMIFDLSSDRYNFNQVYVFYDWGPIVKAALAFGLASIGSALLVLLGELREKPSELLRPKAPKPGKRIFLERIGPIWSRLSFNQKVSYRNLFRYKARMLMVIIGIAGCTGLILAGYGLKDSLGAVSAKQFGPIIDYQAIVTLDEDNLSESNEKAVGEVLAADKKVIDSLPTLNETVEIRQKDAAAQSLTMIVPENTTDFGKFIHLATPAGQKLKLADEQAVITQKMAEYYGIKIGDNVTFYDSEQQPLKVAISNIAMNYLGGFLYLNPDYLQNDLKKGLTANSFLVKSKAMTHQQEDQLSEQLIATDKVVNTTFMSQQIETQDESMANLDAVVIILVTLSGLLAFVVLYNLTNINISERVRELSTIKVLGFFDNEVTMYIVRENIIFTLFGIIGGYGIGYVLTKFILDRASMENLVFPLVLKPLSFVYAGGLTILFTVIVMIVTHFKLKNIDMIDALKANE